MNFHGILHKKKGNSARTGRTPFPPLFFSFFFLLRCVVAWRMCFSVSFPTIKKNNFQLYIIFRGSCALWLKKTENKAFPALSPCPLSLLSRGREKRKSFFPLGVCELSAFWPCCRFFLFFPFFSLSFLKKFCTFFSFLDPLPSPFPAKKTNKRNRCLVDPPNYVCGGTSRCKQKKQKKQKQKKEERVIFFHFFSL